VRWASRNGHVSVVQRLLRDVRVDPSARRQCAIVWACVFGQCDVVRILLDDARVGRDTAALAEGMSQASQRRNAATIALLHRHMDALRVAPNRRT